MKIDPETPGADDTNEREPERACRFCGSKNVYAEYDKHYGMWYVECEDCHACGPVSETRDEAIDNWER